MALFMTTRRTFEVIDGSGPKPKKAELPPGRHEMLRVRNPFGHSNADWLVVKGSMIGGTEGYFRSWMNGTLNKHGDPTDWGDFEISFEETTGEGDFNG